VRQPVRSLEVSEADAGVRLDRYLQHLLSTVPRSRIYRLVRRGEVRINGRRARPEQRLQARDKVRVPPVHELAESAPHRAPRWLQQQIAACIIHEDERVLVLNKPAGLAVHGGSGLSFGVIETLRALRPEESLELAHRLDRDTSGCLLVARKRSALRSLHELLREGEVEKRYLALLRGQWDLGRTRIEVPLRTDTRVGGERTVKAHPSGKPASSEFSPVQFFGSRATLVEVTLHTGRTHQIRVHAAYASHPVAGDEKYGDREFNRELREMGLTRMFLHAHSLSLQWPGGGELSVNAPLPADLASVVDQLGVKAARSPRGAGRRRAR
jgi:23S rRNA pseudouridine955/2504/2580 synthase